MGRFRMGYFQKAGPLDLFGSWASAFNLAQEQPMEPTPQRFSPTCNLSGISLLRKPLRISATPSQLARWLRSPRLRSPSGFLLFRLGPACWLQICVRRLLLPAIACQPGAHGHGQPPPHRRGTAPVRLFLAFACLCLLLLGFGTCT